MRPRLRVWLLVCGVVLFLWAPPAVWGLYVEGADPAEVARHMSAERMARGSQPGPDGPAGADEGSGEVEPAGADASAVRASVNDEGEEDIPQAARWPWAVGGLLLIAAGAGVLLLRAGRFTSVEDGAICLEATGGRRRAKVGLRARGARRTS